MAIFRVLFALVVGLALLPLRAAAKDEACTYGVDCLCDRLKSDASILFCQDFEDPQLANTSVRGHWSETYGPGDDNCLVDRTSVQLWRIGFYPDPAAVSQGRACAAQVSEATCEVPGQVDCVFQGKYSFGHRQQPGKTQGILGTAYFKRTSRRFGATMLIKWSRNYLAPGGSNGPAHKMNEWGQTYSSLMGATNWSSNEVTMNHPFSAGIFTTGTPNPVASLGTVFSNPNVMNFTYFSPDKSKYQWGTTNKVDQWGCFQMHWDGWGTANARYRYWFNGTPIMAGTVNSSSMFQGLDQNGVGSFVWNNYYNGPGSGTGYPGTSVAYRYEDNLVVTDGTEPVSCAAVGFGSGASAPPPSSSLPPSAPVLLP